MEETENVVLLRIKRKKLMLEAAIQFDVHPIEMIRNY